jgi:aminopeptidase N
MRNALGVEYPGIVLIGAERYAEPSDPVFIVTVAHEVAHQWWYNVIGSDVFQEPWLDEGLTTYSSGIYYEFAVGRSAFNGLFSYWQASYDRLLKAGRDAPINWSISEFEQHDPEAYAPVAYSKAALFFDDLRKEIGDEAFFAALRIYFEQNQFTIARSDDLQAAFTQTAGAEVESLFAEWLEQTP